MSSWAKFFVRSSWVFCFFLNVVTVVFGCFVFLNVVTVVFGVLVFDEDSRSSVVFWRSLVRL